MSLRSLLRTAASPRRKAEFVARDEGGVTTLSMFSLLTCCMIAGAAIDVSNLYAQKEHLTLAADAAAFAGIVAVAQNKPSADIKADILAAVEKNIPKAKFGSVAIPATDVQLVRFDPVTKKLVSGTPNAVKVTLRRDDTVANPVENTLLKLVGVDKFEFDVSSVAFYGQPGRCESSDGIYAKGQVTITSGNYIGPSYCVHSQTAVWLPQQNTFAAGSGVSMPSLASCKGKCVDSANPGIEAAKFEMNLNLPKVSTHITKVHDAMMAATSTLKTEVFANKPLATSLSPLTNAKITTKQQEQKLVKGSVVSMTATQYNDLMANTNGNPPGGLVYYVDCKDHGNGPATSIVIGGTTNRKNALLTQNTLETIKGIVLMTDCSFDVGQYARIDNSVLVSTKVATSSVINASEGAVIGDPAKNCDISRKVYILTMSGFSVNSNFTASNVAMIANGDINVAANSNSSQVTHKGTSFHSEATIQIPSSHTFNSCAADNSGLLPGIKTFKYVIPA